MVVSGFRSPLLRTPFRSGTDGKTDSLQRSGNGFYGSSVALVSRRTNCKRYSLPGFELEGRDRIGGASEGWRNQTLSSAEKLLPDRSAGWKFRGRPKFCSSSGSCGSEEKPELFACDQSGRSVPLFSGKGTGGESDGVLRPDVSAGRP